MQNSQTKKYHLVIMGCQMNKSDAERLAAILEMVGYSKTDNEHEADLIGVVACAVRQAAMDRIYGKLRNWQIIKAKRPLITLLSGCVLDYDRKKLQDRFDIFIDIKNLENLPEQIKKITDDQLIDLPSYFKINPVYQSAFQAYVPISTGCNKFCTYCAVPYTRGKEVSRPAKEILEEVNHLIQHGYKEIILVGQNVNSYGLDLQAEIKFPELLKKIDEIEGDYWLRFMTSHPYDMTDDLIEEIAKSNHLANYLHLPVQSGDDEMLRKMNRHYTIEQYKQRINKIRALKPNLSLSTDIIVGYCGETNEQFKNTVKLFEEIKFDMAYISQYSERVGTAGYKLYADDVPNKNKDKRDKDLNKILDANSLAYNKQFQDKIIKVLVEKSDLAAKSILSGAGGLETGKKGTLYKNKGKNSESKTVIFYSPEPHQGQFVNVKISKVLAYGLQGVVQ